MKYAILLKNKQTGGYKMYPELFDELPDLKSALPMYDDKYWEKKVVPIPL